MNTIPHRINGSPVAGSDTAPVFDPATGQEQARVAAVPVPMSYYSFGGWKDSLIGDSPIHGPEGIRFYTRPKVVTTRWPAQAHSVTAGFNFPTSN